MRRKEAGNLFLLVLVSALFVNLGIVKLQQDSRVSRLDEAVFTQNRFRRQWIDDETASYIRTQNDPTVPLGLYWLETNYGEENFSYERSAETFRSLERKWEREEGYETYLQTIRSIWGDIRYFPIPESENDASLSVSFSDSWMNERTYGGKRGHEGTDIIPSKEERGLFPVVSITDGEIVNKGWLEKGGYRLGIEAPGGAYFYYAHLDSYADVEIGDTVQAGDVLGYMGDTGYGPEGTRGQFVVHLHVGIYIYPQGEEISVNPYPVLRFLETRKLKCVYE